MSHVRNRLARTLSVLAVGAAAAALTPGTAAAVDRLSIVEATAAGDHVRVTVRYRCEAELGTDTLAVSLADTREGGVYTATAAPTCDGTWHRSVVSAARGAGPVAAADADAVITASLGVGPGPYVFSTADARATLTLRAPA
ncbi:hypothetical protein [Streptomyces kanamyceticus]|uniref:Secreted protein n=1 Tax=Streptomyces kanamyceticus TaxID=1967 RepID=A0A5J6GEE0_STRKN|nr:hypothetical protein [Streptomyces kanamyceticus]QEU94270.1 hypothetical protein CP970_28200 [Streptomyces kanamyceticus]